MLKKAEEESFNNQGITNSPITIVNSIAGLLKNKPSTDSTVQTLRLLILFNPRYGNMFIINGPFLGKNTIVLIKDSPLQDVIVKKPTAIPPEFTFVDYLYDQPNRLTYWIGDLSYDCLVDDYSDYLDIIFLHVESSYLSKIVTMSDNNTLSIKERGVAFKKLQSKKEIHIDFNNRCLLRGEFYWSAQKVFLKNLISHQHEKVKFNLIRQGQLECYQLVGKLHLLLPENEFDLTISHSSTTQLQFKKYIDTFYLQSNLSLNSLHILPYSIEDSVNSYFKIFWQQQNDFPLQLDGSPGTMKLIIKGKINFPKLTYVAHFSIDNRTQTATFFELNIPELLLDNQPTFKQMLANGFTHFLFYNDQRLTGVNYLPDGQIIYQNICYRLDPDFGLVAIKANLNSSQIENFSYLLKDVPIDLRLYTYVNKKTVNIIQVGDRQLANIAPDARLLTTRGEFIIALLPNFTVTAEAPQAMALQSQSLSTNVSSYLTPPLKMPLSHWLAWAIGTSVALLGTGIVFSWWYCQRNRRLPRTRQTIEIAAAIAVPLLTQPAHAELNTAGKIDTRNKPYKQAYRTEINYSTRDYFEKLPQQILFFHWLSGFFKKLNAKNNITLGKQPQFYEALIHLIQTASYFAGSVSNTEKAEIKKLQLTLFKMTFLIDSNTHELDLKDQKNWGVLIPIFDTIKSIKNKSFHDKDKKIEKRLKTALLDLDNSIIYVQVKSFAYEQEKLDNLLYCLEQISSEKTNCYPINPTKTSWLRLRIQRLYNALEDFVENKKIMFSELIYFTTVILPEINYLPLIDKNKPNHYLLYKQLLLVFEIENTNHFQFPRFNQSKTDPFFCTANSSFFNARPSLTNDLDSFHLKKEVAYPF